jgi:signal transduction histidine kinase
MSDELVVREIDSLKLEMEHLQQQNVAARHRIAVLEGIQEVARSLVSESSLEHLLRNTLRLAVSVMDASAGALLLLDRTTNELVFEVIEGGAGTSLEKTRMSADSGIAGWVATHGEPLIVDDVTRDERYYPRIAQNHDYATRSILCVPMIARLDVIGVLQVLNKSGGGSFTRGDQELLMAFAAQSAVVIENARLYQNLRAERDRIVAVEEEVRHRLARDIHDGPAQMLASVIMGVGFVRKALAHNNPDLALREMDDLQPVADKALRQIRSLLFDLRPVTLETKGLVSALGSYAKMLQENERFTVALGIEGDVVRLSHSAESVIFSVVQEAMSNVRKHANAAHVVIRVTVDTGSSIMVVVKDDGVGFDLRDVERLCDEKHSLGILNMKERAKTVHGVWSITSRPGEGTEVVLRVPIVANLAGSDAAEIAPEGEAPR